ncbi:Short chain dehydrogenase sirQ [Hyphodiscus hymeniophilus]|uniref:Short chain dehydrogenase sirQ n=1 Tax=Hyphodiscus hymeniophilus TaxID=353542 RepID=A0A9P6SQ46_9HELO|nr:Short chain dehydrogenase sirQ [Hyphodiscus hymeniophilus]
MTAKPLQALVFGASGITGWAITNSALSYPTPTTFSRVVGLTSRSLSINEAALPSDPRLELHAGLDLGQDVQSIVKYLSSIERIEEITHVYFAAYVHRGWGDQDSASRKKENVDFIVNAVTAIETVCPGLQFWTYPSGGKWYGFEFGSKVSRVTPLKESAPRISAPFDEHIFYYAQVDALTELAAGKKWDFVDIRPDAIVGFVPNHNAMNIAEPLGLYLSLWKDFGGSNEVPFPGTKESWEHLQSNGSQDLVARFTIYTSLNPKLTAGKSFNIADQDEGVSWSMVWEGIAAYFGLKGVGPLESGQANTGESWVNSQRDHWDAWTKEKGLRAKVLDNTCWYFMTVVTGDYSTFERNFDLGEARRIGFTEQMDHVESYKIAFDRMRAAKILPQ